MDLDTYQELAARTRIYPEKYNVIYTTIQMAAEVGELASLIGKRLRKDQPLQDDDLKAKAKDELGDVLWYVAMLARDFGLSLNEIAKQNIQKLQARYREPNT